MSQDTVMKFFEAVRTEEAVIERLRAVSENGEEFDRLSAELGRERGFAFEPSEVRETLDALARKNEGGLSDQELSAVAGGGTSYAACRYYGGGAGGSAGCTGRAIVGPQWQWVLIAGAYQYVYR